MWRCVSVLVAIVTLLVLIELSSTCNEAVCGSIVSKCLLMQSCKCDYTKCTCCKECYHCLGQRFMECCSCVDMCPKLNDSDLSLSKQSSIETFNDKVPELFKVLTEQPDIELRWVSQTFQIQIDPLQFPPKDYKLQLQSSDPSAKRLHAFINCTVAFHTDCLSHSKCRSHCQSMGSSSVRWFHNGCCECVGEGCIDYGIGEPKCLKCSSSIDSTEPDDLDNGDLYYNNDDDLDDNLDN